MGTEEPAYLELTSTIIDWEALEVDPQVMLDNSARIHTRVNPYTGVEYMTEPVAIVGSGPSLLETWPQIADYKTVYSCSGAHKFLIEHGIVPTYHCESDPRPYKADILGKPHRDVIYLIASLCHPTYFDKLELYRAQVKLWHVYFSEPRSLLNYYPLNEWIFTGGHTIGPRTAKIARIMGHVNLHFYGLDCSVGTHGYTHAEAHPHPPDRFHTVEVGGRKFITDVQWETHAKGFLDDLDHLSEVTYKFFGDGLQQALAKEHKRVPKRYRPLAMQIVNREGVITDDGGSFSLAEHSVR